LEPRDLPGSEATGKSLDVAWEKAFIRPLTFN
jgi:hypothetical protein